MEYATYKKYTWPCTFLCIFRASCKYLKDISPNSQIPISHSNEKNWQIWQAAKYSQQETFKRHLLITQLGGTQLRIVPTAHKMENGSAKCLTVKSFGQHDP